MTASRFLADFFMSLTLSVLVAFFMLTLNAWLKELRGCGGVLRFLLAVFALLSLAFLLYWVSA